MTDPTIIKPGDIDARQLIGYVAYLHGRHPNATAVVLNADTLDILKAWVKSNVTMVDDPTRTPDSVYGMAILRSDDLPIGIIRIAY